MNRSFKHALIFGYAVMALACSHSKVPTGKATLTGEFSGSFPVGQIFTVKVGVPNLILGILQQFDEYEIQLESDGSFSLSIPLFCPVYALLSINEEDYGAVFLSPDKETKIEFLLEESDKMQLKITKGVELTMADINTTNRLFMEFYLKVFDPTTNLGGLQLGMSPEEYRDYILNWTEEQISITVDGTENLPENQKQLISKVMKWHTYIGLLFDYEGQIRYIHENQQSKKETNDPIFTPIKPNKDYYSFLHFFDLNNPPFGNPINYVKMYKQILADSVLNIPNINNQNQPLTDWLKDTKTIMADLIGSDTGLFYDFLAIHAYMQQFEELKPLSDRQKKEIKAYFKTPTFTEFLFEENDATIKQSQLPSTVKETPKVEKEKLMEVIVSQYKGKVVIVDFWATWCGPCLQAMKEIKPLKEEWQGKNIVFIYITQTSSPVELWKKKILTIDGEHYYLNDKEWESIAYSHKYGFKGIPTYLIFDKYGELKKKETVYPGNDAMRKIIEELLQ